MVGSFPWVAIGVSVGVDGVACIMVVAETLMHWDHNALPVALWRLVDRRVPAWALRGRALAVIVVVSSRQQALCLLRRRTLEQCMNLVVGLTVLGCRGL